VDPFGRLWIVATHQGPQVTWRNLKRMEALFTEELIPFLFKIDQSWCPGELHDGEV